VVPELGVVVLDVVSGARVSYILAYVRHNACPKFCGGVEAVIVAAASLARRFLFIYFCSLGIWDWQVTRTGTLYRQVVVLQA
jgi:hypothetical protein